MLNSFMQTVATPRKKVGLLLPSRRDPTGVMVTKLPFPSTSWLGGPLGYMTAVVGAKTAAMDPIPPSSANSLSRFLRIAQSASHVLG